MVWGVMMAHLPTGTARVVGTGFAALSSVACSALSRRACARYFRWQQRASARPARETLKRLWPALSRPGVLPQAYLELVPLVLDTIDGVPLACAKLERWLRVAPGNRLTPKRVNQFAAWLRGSPNAAWSMLLLIAAGVDEAEAWRMAEAGGAADACDALTDAMAGASADASPDFISHINTAPTFTLERPSHA